MPRLRFLPTLATTLLVLAGCDTPTAITPQRNQLENAPTQVRVAGHDLVLGAYVGRDFMPIAPPDGHPMVAVLRIRTVDGRPFPAGVTADKVSVLYGGDVWTAAARQEPASQRPGTLEVVARDGPRWPPGATVDVVVYLRDAAGGEHLLRAANQRIERSD